jgi:prepilin-type N-terminal cleavage/methylation domain-containing protein
MLLSNAQRPSMSTGIRASFVSARGYTLMEMVTVLAIITIIGAMAAPRWGSSVARARVNAAVQRITADLNAASVQARATSKPVTLIFNTAKVDYTISNARTLDLRVASYAVELDEEPYLVRLDSVDFGGGKTLTFNACGEADLDGSIVLSAGSFQRTIKFYANTREAIVQ